VNEVVAHPSAGGVLGGGLETCGCSTKVELDCPHWYAIYTSARHEKTVAEHLRHREVEHFLPLYHTVHDWKNGRKKLQLPLFPGYVFVRIAARSRLRVLEVPGVAYIVGNGQRPWPLPASEIRNLQNAIGSDRALEPHRFLTVGQRVRVVRGPLAGAEGILVRKKDNSRVVLSVDLIMRSVAVDVDQYEIEPIGRQLPL
jgi:transcription antitermination factor NusG